MVGVPRLVSSLVVSVRQTWSAVKLLIDHHEHAMLAFGNQ